METGFADLREYGEKERKDAFAHAGEIIRRGGLVAFPTETVYGLGGDALNPESSKKIYEAKGRPSDNPLIVHICRMEDLDRIARYVPEEARLLAEAFWPGPLTMIFYKNDIVPEETTGGLDTVAVRFPDHPDALEFIKAAGGYIAAPSANTSGRPSPTIARHVKEDLDGKIDMILDGGEVGIGVESTIVDFTEAEPTILRPGYVTEEMLCSVLGAVDTDPTILRADSKEAPKAPGMKYRHYAPRAVMSLVEGESREVAKRMEELTKEAQAEGKKVGILCTEEMLGILHGDVIKCVGSRKDPASIARNLYRVLREFDGEDVDVIFSESFSKEGFGQAVMNRLLKAAGQTVIRV